MIVPAGCFTKRHGIGNAETRIQATGFDILLQVFDQIRILRASHSRTLYLR